MGRGLYSPTIVPTWVPTLMLSLDQAARAHVRLVASGPFTSPAFVGPGFVYEGDLYRAVEVAGLSLRPGAVYLGVVFGALRAQLVDLVAYLEADLSPAPLAALVATLNALVP